MAAFVSCTQLIAVLGLDLRRHIHHRSSTPDHQLLPGAALPSSYTDPTPHHLAFNGSTLSVTLSIQDIHLVASHITSGRPCQAFCKIQLCWCSLLEPWSHVHAQKGLYTFITLPLPNSSRDPLDIDADWLGCCFTALMIRNGSHLGRIHWGFFRSHSLAMDWARRCK